MDPAGAASVIEAEAHMGPVACQAVFNHPEPLCDGSQDKQELYRSLLLRRRFQIYVHSKMMVVDDEVSPPDALLCLWGRKAGCVAVSVAVFLWQDSCAAHLWARRQHAAVDL